ncbi:MAG: tRNA (guanosine(37)-N1)-methyltransferase TrmD [Patescibacteria group bacterium]
MTIDIITLFPKMFTGPFDESIVKRAQEKKLAEINLHDLRKFAIDKRGTVDDRPYGGGTGMILRVDVLAAVLKKFKKAHKILLDPRGTKFTQAKARELSKLKQIVLVCGHYEGVDERVREHLVDEAISVGDYVLTGGEIPAMIITDAVTRLIPGVLEKPEATEIESFSKRSRRSCSCESDFEYPQYTRPGEFNGWKVPEILLSGNHEEIKKWRENHF